MVGVSTTFTRGGSGGGGAERPREASPSRSALRPGRRREDDLALREVVGPHDDLLLLLPLERDHLVRGLKAVQVDLVVAEHRAHLELEQLLAHLVGLEARRTLDALGIEEAARVAGRGVIRRLVLELGLVRLVELLVAGIVQYGLP